MVVVYLAMKKIKKKIYKKNYKVDQRPPGEVFRDRFF